MSSYLDNGTGVSTSTGTGDLVITNNIDQFGPIVGEAVDGATYPYYIRYVDIADGSDYETGRGTWDAGTNSLSRDTITSSSNNGLAVNWSAAQKAVFITADTNLSTDMENMVESSTKKILTATERTNIAASKVKTDLITVTQPVDLDQMEAEIAAFSGGMTYRGNWDASTGVFPGGGVGSNGDYWYCSVSGVVDTVSFDAGDSIVALVNNPSISTFPGYWSRHDSMDAVQSVAGLTGTITAGALRTAINVEDGAEVNPTASEIKTLYESNANTNAFTDANETALSTATSDLATAAQRMAFFLARIPEDIDIIISGEGQSLFGYQPHGGISDADLLTIAPNWLDWRYDGVDHDWSTVDTSVLYSYQSGTDDIQTGAPSRALINSVEVPCCHWGSALAHYLANMFPTRKFRTIFTFRGGTAINDPEGWVYDPGSNNTAERHSNQVAAAIAAMHIDDPTQSSTTHVHIHCWSQGQSDAINGLDSNVYGGYALQHIQACENDDQYGYCDENTLYLLGDTGEGMRQLYPTFSGIQIMQALIGARAIIVDLDNVPKSDFVHIKSDGHAQIGKRLADTFAGSSLYQMSVWGNAAGKWLADMYELEAPYTYLAKSDSTVPSAGQIVLNLASTRFRVSYIDSLFFPYTSNMLNIGLDKVPIGYRISVSKASAPTVPVIYIELTSKCTIVPSTYDYLEWTCIVTAGTGSLSASDSVILTSTDNLYLWNGEDASVTIPAKLKSAIYESGQDIASIGTGINPRRTLCVTPEGQVYRSSAIEPMVIETTIASSSGFADTLWAWIPPNDQVGCMTAEIIGFRTSDNTVAHFILTCHFKRISGTLTVIWDEVQVVNNGPGIGGNFVQIVASAGALTVTTPGTSGNPYKWRTSAHIVMMDF